MLKTTFFIHFLYVSAFFVFRFPNAQIFLLKQLKKFVIGNNCR